MRFFRAGVILKTPGRIEVGAAKVGRRYYGQGKRDHSRGIRGDDPPANFLKAVAELTIRLAKQASGAWLVELTEVPVTLAQRGLRPSGSRGECRRCPGNHHGTSPA